jgi:CRISPR-associated endonuclease/helicase Cas3
METWQELLADVWAKSPEDGQPRGELLTEHTEHVLHRVAQLQRRFPFLPGLVEDERLWHRLFWACCLHDTGKATHPFQNVLRGDPGDWGRKHHRHEVGSLAFVPWVTGDNDEDATWITAAIVSHHRDGPVIDGLYDPNVREALDLPMLAGGIADRTLNGMAAWLAQIPAAWPDGDAFIELGVEPPSALPLPVDGTAFREWEAGDAIVRLLRAYRRLRMQLEDERADSLLNRRAIAYRALMLLADRLGSAHAPALATLRLPDVTGLLGPSPRLRDHQTRAASAEGSIVLNAPTGSGKTEAALLWALRQQQVGRGSTLLYMLPYQASINAMQERLARSLQTPVGLLHGRATQVLFRRFLSDEYSSRRATAAARNATNLARLQQPAVRVSTPYQVLRAAYRLPGYEPIWTTLAGSLVVVDEIHAYEPKRLGMFLGLLGALVRLWDVRICAITATMPRWLRRLVAESWGAGQLSASDVDFAAFRRHRLYLRDAEIGDAAVLDWIADLVRSGRSVLIAVNTVRRAQATKTALEQRLGSSSVRLLHSRFTGRDRLAAEEELMRTMGLGSTVRSALAVVATQTIEVSLNLDFDTIVSEPAPLEALAQRFGRVNRRGRLSEAPVYVLTRPEDGQMVYRDDLVRNTIAVLRTVDGEPLDEAGISALLDGVYRDGLTEEFTREVQRAQRDFDRDCLRSLRAFKSDEDLEQSFDALFEGTEVLPAALEAEYSERSQSSALDAQSLLVPISGRQFVRLRRLDLVRLLPDRTRVVEVPYDEQGLRLDLVGHDVPQDD